MCVENMLAHLAKGKVFTKLNLQEAYYWVQIKKGGEWRGGMASTWRHNAFLGCSQENVDIEVVWGLY